MRSSSAISARSQVARAGASMPSAASATRAKASAKPTVLSPETQEAEGGAGGEETCSLERRHGRGKRRQPIDHDQRPPAEDDTDERCRTIGAKHRKKRRQHPKRAAGGSAKRGRDAAAAE
jgi:hypothetical protein